MDIKIGNYEVNIAKGVAKMEQRRQDAPQILKKKPRYSEDEAR